MPTDGSKPVLMERLDSYYRPLKKQKTHDDNNNSTVPTIYEIEKMTRCQLEQKLESLGLSKIGAELVLAKRLEDYYHTPQHSNTTTVLPTCNEMCIHDDTQKDDVKEDTFKDDEEDDEEDSVTDDEKEQQDDTH